MDVTGVTLTGDTVNARFKCGVGQFWGRAARHYTRPELNGSGRSLRSQPGSERELGDPDMHGWDDETLACAAASGLTTL